jgi:hypothetical protein
VRAKVGRWVFVSKITRPSWMSDVGLRDDLSLPVAFGVWLCRGQRPMPATERNNR